MAQELGQVSECGQLGFGRADVMQRIKDGDFVELESKYI